VVVAYKGCAKEKGKAKRLEKVAIAEICPTNEFQKRGELMIRGHIVTIQHIS